MRLIDADAIHSTLADWQLMLSETYGTNDEFVRCLEDVLCTVDNAPTIPAQRWHRVEDDYPDLLQFVVVCNDDGKCVVAQYVGYQTDSLTPWRIAYTMYDTDAYYEMENGPVRYWMPIEPPKEDA